MNYADSVESAILMTEEMLKEATKGDWDKVVEIEQRRSHLLNALNVNSHENTLPSENITARLKALLALNVKLTDLGGAQKIEYFKQFSSGKKAAKAFNSYTGY